MSSQQLTSDRLEYDDATDVIESYMSKGWTDGLPIVPPTPEKVSAFLEHSGRSPSEIVGAEPVRGRAITAEKVAINSVMAGCLPEHFPVVLAAVEAMCEPQFNLHAVTVSTMGVAVLTVVNGPITRELGLNSGVNVFGPGNRGNATIGRALRLVISNVTGAVPGELDKATLGHAGRYTWCMAEAEEVSPWEPLHVQRGLTAEQSAVTVFAGLSPIQVGSGQSTRPDAVLAGLRHGLFAAGPGQDEIVVVLTPEIIGHIKAEGWTKQQAAEHLFQVSRRSASEWAGGTPLEGDELTGVAQSPDGITLLVAGGAAGGSAAIIPLWGGGSNSRSFTREIRAT